MSCPYFDPVQPRGGFDNPRFAMLPLGDCWSGICRALAGQPSQPDEAFLQSCCNLGYARGTCARFPDRHGPDAVRFTVLGDDGASLRLYYVLECGHRPFAHGPLEYFLATGQLTPTPLSELTERQLRAYVRSYIRRKSGAL
jgi:hypothetical protein